MKDISWATARDNYNNNPICKKGVTPFNLITFGLVTYQEWLEALYVDTDPIDEYIDEDHIVAHTIFGKKVLEFVHSLGYDAFMFAPKHKRRTQDCELESIKLINQRLRLVYSSEEGNQDFGK